MDADSAPADGRFDEIGAAVSSAGFTVTQRTYPRDLHYSGQQWLDHAFTHSNHLTLDAAEANELAGGWPTGSARMAWRSTRRRSRSSRRLDDASVPIVVASAVG